VLPLTAVLAQVHEQLPCTVVPISNSVEGIAVKSVCLELSKVLPALGVKHSLATSLSSLGPGLHSCTSHPMDEATVIADVEKIVILHQILDRSNDLVAKKVARFACHGVPFLHSKRIFRPENVTQPRLWGLLHGLAKEAPNDLDWHHGKENIDASRYPFTHLPVACHSGLTCPHVILLTTFCHSALSFDESVNKQIRCVWCGGCFENFPAKYLFAVDITPFPAYPITFTKVFADGCIVKMVPDSPLSARAHLS
jgi:hypothetical protein